MYQTLKSVHTQSAYGFGEVVAKSTHVHLHMPLCSFTEFYLYILYIMCSFGTKVKVLVLCLMCSFVTNGKVLVGVSPHTCARSRFNTHAHAHASTHMRTLTLQHTCARSRFNTHAHAHASTHMRTLTLQHTCARSRFNTHAHAHASTCLRGLLMGQRAMADLPYVHLHYIKLGFKGPCEHT